MIKEKSLNKRALTKHQKRSVNVGRVLFIFFLADPFFFSAFDKFNQFSDAF